MISNRKPTYQDLLERTRGAQYRVHQNTRAGWYNIGQLNTAIQKDMYKEYLFMVDIPADPKDESNDVLNLQYYFVRTERALRTKRELGENAVFILLVTVHSQDDRFRVSSYLHLQSVYRTDMLFYISYSGHIYEPQKDLEGIRRLCPLICVTKTKTWNNLFYQNLLKGAKLTERQIICCRDTAIKVLQTESGKKYQGSDKDDLMTSNEGDGTGDEALAQDDTDNNKKQRSRLQNLIKSEEFKTKDQRINLQIITANYLMEGFCKIKGVKGKPLQVKEKCILINEVCDYILQRNEPLTLLGQLIWFCIYTTFRIRTSS